MCVYPGKRLEENIASCQHSLKDYMIYVKQQSPCIGECQNPQLGVEVIFHANSELFIIEEKTPKQDMFPYAALEHLSFNCDQIINHFSGNWRRLLGFQVKSRGFLFIIKYAN